MSNPLNENMQLVTYVTVDSLNPNSSAMFLTPPVAYLPVETRLAIQPLPFDPDGDSFILEYGYTTWSWWCRKWLCISF